MFELRDVSVAMFELPKLEVTIFEVVTFIFVALICGLITLPWIAFDT